MIYAALGEKDHAFEHLEKSFEERSAIMSYLKTDLQVESLRDDPRFSALLARIGLG